MARASNGRSIAVAFVLLLSALGAFVGGCDQGVPHDAKTSAERAPYLTIVGSNVGVDKPLPIDGSIKIAFDRFLLPLTASRQSFQLADAFGNSPGSAIVTYDPVARVVTLSNPNAPGDLWLLPNQPYKVLIGIPKGDDDGSGPRAIDRATLDPAGAPYVIGFITTAAPKTPTPQSDAVVDYCRDVQPIFSAKCSGSICHHAPKGDASPVEGLLLQTSIGVRNTAIDRVAKESSTSGRSLPEPPGALFGVNMPIVAPFDPGNSWLMYKVLLARPRPEDAALDASSPICFVANPTPGQPPIAQVSPHSAIVTLPPMQPLSDDERARLADYVLGREMPYPLNLPNGDVSTDPSTLPLTFDELERIRAWIAQGALVNDCALCVE